MTNARAAIVAMALACGGRALDAQPAIERQRLDARDLRAAGVARIADLLLLAEGWTVATVDGATWAASPDALPDAHPVHPGTAEWLLLVDEHRIELDVLGGRALELLPAQLSDIDSVVVERGPTFAAGAFASRGVLRVHTRVPGAGPSVRARLDVGNETGDAGPYRYTTRGTPNVDHTGADLAFSAEYGASTLWTRAGVRRQIHSATDPAIAGRVDRVRIAGEHPLVGTTVPTLRLGGSHSGWEVDVLAARSRLSGYATLAPPGREVALRQVHTAASVAGRGQLSAGTRARWRLGYTTLDFADRGSTAVTAPAHRRANLRASADVGTRGVRGSAVLGASVSRWSVATTDSLRGAADEMRAEAAVFAEGARVWTPAVRQHLLAELRGGRQLVGMAALATTVRSGRQSSARLTAGRAARAHGQDGAWIDAAVDEGESPPANVTTWIDAAWTRAIPGWATADVGTRYSRRTVADVGVVGPRVGVDRGSLRGAMVEARAALAAVWPRASARVYYRHARRASGDSAFAVAAPSVPAHVLQARLVAQPAGSLLLGASYQLRSRTRWAGALLTDSTGDATPSISRLDLTVQKSIWRDRVSAGLFFRNMLGKPQRYHPAGAGFDPSYHLSVSVHLDQRR